MPRLSGEARGVRGHGVGLGLYGLSYHTCMLG